MKQTKFNEYKDENPRSFPEDMQDFLEFAKKEYLNYDNVNWTYPENEEEMKEETKSYVSESMEAILLFKEFMKEKEQ